MLICIALILSSGYLSHRSVMMRYPILLNVRFGVLFLNSVRHKNKRHDKTFVCYWFCHIGFIPTSWVDKYFIIRKMYRNKAAFFSCIFYILFTLFFLFYIQSQKFPKLSTSVILRTYIILNCVLLFKIHWSLTLTTTVLSISDWCTSNN